jgi:hypothetical protein
MKIGLSCERVNWNFPVLKRHLAIYNIQYMPPPHPRMRASISLHITAPNLVRLNPGVGERWVVIHTLPCPVIQWSSDPCPCFSNTRVYVPPYVVCIVILGCHRIGLNTRWILWEDLWIVLVAYSSVLSVASPALTKRGSVNSNQIVLFLLTELSKLHEKSVFPENKWDTHHLIPPPPHLPVAMTD